MPGRTDWIAIRAQAVEAAPRTEVEISVEDKGIGIRRRCRACFEPFYRVQAVRDGQIRGRGAGTLPGEALDGRHGRTSDRQQRRTGVVRASAYTFRWRGDR